MITYSSTLLKIPGKKHILTPDENGYYLVAAGALNAFNSAGMFYLMDKSKAAFDKSSAFMRRVSEGSLYAEFGHPKLAGMSTSAFIQRANNIDENNICAHISDVILTPNGAIDQRGKPICLITLRVKPWGPRAKDLETALANPEQNVCFSIRCLADTAINNGLTTKAILEVITFDFVIEPGIFEAKKRYSPALESFSEDNDGIDSTEVVITNEDVRQFKVMINEVLGSMEAVSLESDQTRNTDKLIHRLEGYMKPSSGLPASSLW